MYSLQLQVSLVRFFRRVKSAFADAFTISHNLHKPFTLVWANTQKPRFVGFCWFAHILQISKPGDFSEIIKRIVLFISVFVVNMPHRGNTGYMQPSQSMRKLFLVINRNRPIPQASWATRTFADKIGAALMRLPHKIARFGVVVQNRSNMVSGNHEFEFTIKVVK